jgi:hypothetical protein
MKTPTTDLRPRRAYSESHSSSVGLAGDGVYGGGEVASVSRVAVRAGQGVQFVCLSLRGHQSRCAAKSGRRSGVVHLLSGDVWGHPLTTVTDGRRRGGGVHK